MRDQTLEVAADPTCDAEETYADNRYLKHSDAGMEGGSADDPGGGAHQTDT